MTFAEFYAKKKREGNTSAVPATPAVQPLEQRSLPVNKDMTFRQFYEAKKASLDSWGKESTTFLRSLGDRSENWFDSEQRQLRSRRADQLIATGRSWRNQYQDNPYAQQYIDSLESAISEAKGYWDSMGDYYTQWDSREAFDNFETLRTMDLDAGEREIADLDSLIEQQRQRVQASRGEHRFSGNSHPDIQEFNRLQALRSEKNAQLNQARRIQEGYQFSGVADENSDLYDKEFPTLSQYQSTEVEDTGFYRDPTYEYINGKDNGVREELAAKSSMESHVGLPDFGALALYDGMTEGEIGIYNYYYAREGRERAEEYLDSIREQLNYREASGMYSVLETQTALEMLFKAAAGLDQFGSGITSLLNTEDDYIPQSTMQQLSGMITEDLADVGPKLPQWLGGQSLGQVAGDIVSTTANMAPSILAGWFLGPGVGTALMGASAAGGAYQEALNLGYDKGQARFYSTLVGASEAALEKVLGGISALGGGMARRAAAMLDGVDNALFRIGGKWLAGMASEGFEEGLQEVLTPVFENLALKAGNTWEDIDWSEAAYSVLLGALSGGLLEGVHLASENKTTTQTGQRLQEAGISAQRLAELGSTMSADSVAYQLAGKVNENTGAYTMGRMFQEIGATLTEQNQSDIVQALESRGMTAKDARTHARVLAHIVDGGLITEAQREVIEGNEILSQVMQEVLIDENSTVYQRQQGYRDMLKALARQATGVQQSAEPEISTDLDEVTEENGSPQPPAQTAPQGEAQTSQAAEVPAGETEDGSLEPIRQEVSKLDLLEGEANVLIQGYQPHEYVTPAEYGMQIRHAYQLGRMGIAPQQANTSTLTRFLSQSQRETAYRMGRAAALREDTARGRSTDAGSRTAPVGDYVEVDDSLRGNLTPEEMDQLEAIDHVANVLQKKVFIHDLEGMDPILRQVNGWYDGDGNIHLNVRAGQNQQGTMMFTFAHELTHDMRRNAPKEFRRLADFLMEEYGRRNVTVEQLVAAKLETVERMHKEENLSEEELWDLAWEEVVADSMEPMLTDGRVLEKLRQRDKSTWEVLKDLIHDLAERIRAAYARLKPDSTEGRHVQQWKDKIEEIEDLFTEGLVAARGTQTQKNPTQEGGMAASVRYSLRTEFAAEYDAWDKKTPDFSFTVGKTSEVLKQLGVKDAPITWDASKIIRIKSKHKEMTDAVIKQVPGILENPIVVMGSKTKSGRLTLFGEVYVQNKPILAVLELNPTGRNGVLLDQLKIASAYGKDNAQTLLNTSEILYRDPDKKRISEWEKRTRLQLPVSNSITNSSANSVPQEPGESQGKVRYQERNPALNAMNAMAREENAMMREGLSDWREAFEALGISRRGGIFTKASVKAVAEQMKKRANAQGNTQELTELLTTAYTNLASLRNPSWADVVQEFQPVMTWLMEHRKAELDGRAQEILTQMKGSRIYLDQQQKAEAKYLYGQYGDYVRKTLGKVKLTDKNSVSLDAWWQAMAAEYPDIFPPDTSSNDMVQGLLDAEARLREMTLDRTFGIDRMTLEQDFLQAFYHGLFQATVYPEYMGTEIRKLTLENQKKIQNIRKAHEKRMDNLNTYHDVKVQELRGKYAERQEKARENRERAAKRHKIQRTAGWLNSMILRESKTRHIQESMKVAVVDILDRVNMDTVMAEERVKQLEKELANTSDPYKRKEIEDRIFEVRDIGGRVHERIAKLKAAYAAFRAQAEGTEQAELGDVVMGLFAQFEESVGDTPLRNMSLKQLAIVDELLTAVHTTVLNANETLATEQAENTEALGKKVISEEIAQGQKAQRWAPTGKYREYVWNNLKPIYAHLRLGSETLTRLFENVRKGEDTWARDMEEARKFKEAMAERFGFGKWNMEATREFTDRTGKKFRLNLGQMMTLYAYSKRPQSWEHLQKGGFVFKASPETRLIRMEETTITDANGKEVKVKKWVPAMEWTQEQSFKVDALILGDIVSKLTPEQKQFADRMQSFLSNTMGAKGNEVSMKMYGIKLFKEQYYFPLKSARAFLIQEAQKANGEIKIKNKGFTKDTVVKANNPIYLMDFMDAWSDHVNEMSLYHGMTLPMEDYYRVRNYKEGIAEPEGTEVPDQAASVTNAIQGAHGPEATAYIDRLLKDLNGGAIGDSRENMGRSFSSLHKKAAVMASLSVIVQQPTSIYRAMGMIDMKHFALDTALVPSVIRTFNGKKHRALWEELKTYAPVAIIKEMGSFDTSVGRSARDYLEGTDYDGLKEKVKAFVADGSYRDEILGKLPALADEMAWVSIWQAVKRETQAKNPRLLTQNEAEFYRIAGERFTEVITRTQVYDSVLSRSDNMRSKSFYMSMATAFMAEPTTTANMVQYAASQWRKGDRKAARQLLGGVAGSILVNSALVSIVYALRDDDEESTFAEKYFSRFASELIDGFNPLGYLPYVKDLWSIMQGYDVERSDMALWSDLLTAVNKMAGVLNKDTDQMDEAELAEHEKALANAGWAMVDIISSFFGIPWKNLRRDTVAVLRAFSGKGSSTGRTTRASMVDKVLEEVSNAIPGGPFARGSTGDKLYRATLLGDQEYVRRLQGSYSSASAATNALRKALRLNDSRIHEAAVARSNGRLSEYERIARQIIREKHFTQDDVVAAINAEINAMSSGESTEPAAKAKSLYEAADLVSAIRQGSSSLGENIREEIIRVAQLNGKTEEEAQESFVSAARSAIQDALLEGEISRDKALEALEEYCGQTEQEARADVAYWEFKVSNPDTYANSAWFDTYYREVEASGLDIGTYMDYRDQVRDITGEGKKERRLAVIHSLPITNAQKDALYLAEGWTENKLWEAPWH